MNYLTALLAFSAIMIVLTTLATVVVEGLHRLSRRRATDFQHMLACLYTDAIRPRVESAIGGHLPSDQEFVAELVRNPAVEPGWPRWLTKIPVLHRLADNVFDTRFQELTTRQFVEQLAQTEAGRRLAELARTDTATPTSEPVTALIAKFSYEFERYGEAASSYFQRRATTLSVAVAFGLAMTLNIDAFRLYSALAQDDTLAEQIISSIDISELEASYQDRLRQAQSEEEPGAPEELDDAFAAVLTRIRADAEELQRQGLPVGFDYFPYCGSAADSRCEGLTSSTFSSAAPLVGPLVTFVGRTVANARTRVFGSSNGYGWLFSVLVTGGLIGLGAPFWFKTYRFVASFVPGLTLPDGTRQRRARPTSSGRQSGEDPAPSGVSTGTSGSAGAASSGAPSTARTDGPHEEGLSASDLYEAFMTTERR